MKYCFLIFVCITCGYFARSQVTKKLDKNNITEMPAGNTYAVVIGIANYENENINLNYANRDAQEFAGYLQSNAGGSVPADNIKLLIDTNATTAAIYNALAWLRDRCEDDKRENSEKTNLVYFYFSGHGDVETNTKANLGFLLSFNTPLTNYLNNAVRIEDLNNYAHTLSVDMNAKVIIITDACHSGKLAGSDNRGTYLVGKELSTAREKEVRIASCLPDQLANEDIRWGGGRGIFSYYLINGLKGLADKNKDAVITLDEIKFYVDSAIANDPVVISEKLKQTPVLEGNNRFRLSSVDSAALISVQQYIRVEVPVLTAREYFFKELKNNEKLEAVAFEKLSGLRREEIPEKFIEEVKKIIDTTAAAGRIGEMENAIRQDSAERENFITSLIELLHSAGQRVINQYLTGDEAELEKRRYYNSTGKGYDIYPAMYETALQLTAPDNPLLQMLKVNQLYFKGIAARIKIPLTELAKQDQLLDTAMVYIGQALELSPEAAYIQNEMGILRLTKKEYDEAEKHFQQASVLAPDWAIPQANLCGLYSLTGNFDKANEAAERAESLQPGLQLTLMNRGIENELSGNQLFAEEFYRKAIDINSRHYLPFERLGYVYTKTTHYAQADSFFYEAELRKKGFHFRKNETIHIPEMVVLAPAVPRFCDVDTLALKKDDILAFFTWGVQNYEKRDYNNAVRILKKVIALDKRNPLVFHYMGKIFYDQQKWEEAEVMFTYALSYYLDSANFKKYCDSVIKSKKYQYPHDCFENFYRFSYYIKSEDYFFLATTYEAWGHFEEAESVYRAAIRLNKKNLHGYIKLRNMLEKTGRYTEAEQVIKNYAIYEKERSDRELNAFYRRVIGLFPGVGDWPYRLGLFLYERVPRQSAAKYLDTIIWFPGLNKEVFIDEDNYQRLDKDLKWDLNLAGSPKEIVIENFRETTATIEIPGTGESIILADAIYTPRKDVITFLNQAAGLLKETETLADIHFKIGNVFVRAGSKKQAFPYYSRSVEMVPENAGARLNLVDVCKAIYENRAGLLHMNYLYDSGQINFSKRLLLSEFLIHSGQFEKAKKLIGEAQSIHPYVVPETFELLGRLHLMSGKMEQAKINYLDYLGIRTSSAETMYIMACITAKTGNQDEAWKWLEKALQKGFRYSWVLQSDPLLAKLRDTENWNRLIMKFPMKKYKSTSVAAN